MALIEVNDLKKNFDDFQAVKGVSFSIEKGEIFGFLGPNGAGKTITINMMVPYCLWQTCPGQIIDNRIVLIYNKNCNDYNLST